MKKIFISIIFALLSVSLFCGDVTKETIHEETRIVKKLESKIFNVHYSILEDSEGLTVLDLTDDGIDHFRVQVLLDSVQDAFDFYFELEKYFSGIFMEALEQPIILEKITNNPLFIFIAMDDYYYSWEYNEVLEEYVYIINERTFNRYSDDVTVLTVLDYEDSTSPNAFDNNKYIWEAFQEAHPDIKIERELLFNEPFHQKTEAYAASGKMPDVFYMWPAGRSTLIHEKKLAKDLTPLLKRDGLLDKYSPACMDPKQQKSGYVAEIPFGLTVTNCTIANTKVLKECGLKPAKTYEELKAQLPILRANGKELIIMANHDDWVMQSCLFSMIVGRYGGVNWANDILEGRAKFTDAPFKKAVQMVKTMYDDGVLSQTSLATPYGDVPGQFATEKGAYLVDGDWRTGAFMTDASTGLALIDLDRQETDIELILFPSLPGELYHNTNSGTLGVGYGMSSAIEEGSKKEEAAWELIKWLSGPEMQQRRLNTGASFPSLEKGVSYNGFEPIVKKRADFYYKPEMLTPVFDSQFSSIVSAVANAKLQELGLGKCSVDEVCQAIQDAYDADDYYY